MCQQAWDAGPHGLWAIQLSLVVVLPPYLLEKMCCYVSCLVVEVVG